MWRVMVQTKMFDTPFSATIFEGTRDQCERMAQQAIGLPVHGGGRINDAWAEPVEETQAVAPHGFE